MHAPLLVCFAFSRGCSSTPGDCSLSCGHRDLIVRVNVRITMTTNKFDPTRSAAETEIMLLNGRIPDLCRDGICAILSESQNV